MVDFRIIDDGDGGNITFKGGDITPETSFYTSVYLSLFSGDSFYNIFVKDETTNEFEDALLEPITTDQLRKIENIAIDSLSWAITDGLASSVTAEAYQVGVSKLRIYITLTEPSGAEQKYSFIWDQELKELSGV